jgi:peptidoglycan/LPS O-acetylase OafA/YrhL
MKYRADVDGLRAVAVLAVVLFHAGIPGLPGGFVGVDVFFVISGFLITRIITEEIDASRFSLLRFYERRARRILPALFAMMAVTAAVAAVFLIPDALADFGRSAAAAALSVSNVYFWRTSGYFDLSAPFVPLLHTWSLGVEEQFYLVVPLYLLAARKLTRLSWPIILAPVVVLSFALSVWLVRASENAAFYLPFGRMWELGLGSLLAVGATPPLRKGWIAEGLAAGGLALLLFAIVRYGEGMRFPGEAALIPCVGAGLLIYTGGTGTWVGRLLSSRPMVGIGLVSYSLYLWHWPALVFFRILVGRQPTAWEGLALVIAMLGLAWASWRWIEQPFRKGALRTQKAVFAASAAAIAASAVVGVGLSAAAGLPQRFTPETRRLAEAATDVNPDRKRCDSPSPDRVAAGKLCVVGAAGVTPTIALVGDSFGDALAPGVAQAAADHGQAVLVMTRAGCRPLIGVTRPGSPCELFIEAVAHRVASSPDIQRVILVGRWSAMVEGDRFGVVKRGKAYLAEQGSTAPPTYEGGQRAFVHALSRTLDAFGAKPVFLVAHLPEQETLVPQSATVRAILHRPAPAGVSRARFEARQAATRRLLSGVKGSRVTLIDASQTLCDAAHCPVVADGEALYFDDNHLSKTGAVRARDMLAPAFTSVAPAGQTPATLTVGRGFKGQTGEADG